MKTLVFDTGPIISFAMNGLLPVFPLLKEQFKGDFLIPRRVREELVDHPIESKKFKFEALQVLHIIEKGVLQVEHSPQLHETAQQLLNTANYVFEANGKNMEVVHFAEMEALALAIETNAEALVVDERTTRLLLEHPQRSADILSRKLETKISINRQALQEFKQLTKGVRCLRSTELALMAYEHGLLDQFVLHIPEARKQLLQGLLWGIKLSGCSITQREIDTIVKMELKS